MLANDDPEIQVRTLRAIDTWDVSLSSDHEAAIARLLEAPDVRCDAARVLLRRGSPEQQRVALAVVLDEMSVQDPDPKSCRSTAHRALDTAGAEAIVELIRLLDSPFKSTKRRAIITLGGIDPPTEATLRAIAGRLGDPEIAGNASQELGQIGPPAVAVLTAALRNDNPLARENAALALGRIGPDAASATPTLVTGLPEQTGASKRRFLFALAQIAGPEAQQAVPALRDLLNDSDYRALAASALARIERDDAVDLAPEIVAMLAEQSKGTCPHPTAQHDLRAIGPVAVPPIVAALGDPDYEPKWQLLRILDEFGTDALETARPVFEHWLEYGHDRQRLDAAERLQQLDGVTSDELLDVFEFHLDSGNAWYRLRGAEGIMRSGTDRIARATSTLEELRHHRYDSIRKRSDEALGVKFGTSDRP